MFFLSGGMYAEIRSFQPRLLEDEDGGVRWGAAEALGNIGAASASAMEALILITEDEEEDARQAAVQTLGKLAKLNVIRRAELVEPLCQALSDDEWSVRRAAAEALGRCGDEASGVRLLLQRVARADPHARVQQAAALALTAIANSPPAAETSEPAGA